MSYLKNKLNYSIFFTILSLFFFYIINQNTYSINNPPTTPYESSECTKPSNDHVHNTSEPNSPKSYHSTHGSKYRMYRSHIRYSPYRDPNATYVQPAEVKLPEVMEDTNIISNYSYDSKSAESPSHCPSIDPDIDIQSILNRDDGLSVMMQNGIYNDNASVFESFV